jgi:hypothetical protein
VGKGKRADIYLEVNKRRGHIFLNETSVCAATTIVYIFPFKKNFQNTTKRKEFFSLKRTTFVYVLSSDW